MRWHAHRRICAFALIWVACWAGADCNAEVFYSGQPKGFPGAPVNLTINVRAGTVLEAIDIVPDLTAVAGVLDFVALEETLALTDGGTGLCTGQACAFFYLTGKSFAADAVLATLRFTIDPNAPIGPVAFDPGVTVGSGQLPIPQGSGFEVLAVPEPASAALVLAGLFGIAYVLRRRAQLRTG